MSQGVDGYKCANTSYVQSRRGEGIHLYPPCIHICTCDTVQISEGCMYSLRERGKNSHLFTYSNDGILEHSTPHRRRFSTTTTIVRIGDVTYDICRISISRYISGPISPVQIDTQRFCNDLCKCYNLRKN